MPHRGHLEGDQLLPRTIAGLCHKQGWRDLDLITAVAVCLAESAGYDRAYCDNLDDRGRLLSRDVGLFQINIPARLVGKPYEKVLYGHEANLEAAWKLYQDRGWQPWHAYTSGIALGPQWKGRYVQRAVRGVANYYAERLKVDPVPLLDFR